MRISDLISENFLEVDIRFFFIFRGWRVFFSGYFFFWFLRFYCKSMFGRDELGLFFRFIGYRVIFMIGSGEEFGGNVGVIEFFICVFSWIFV